MVVEYQWRLCDVMCTVVDTSPPTQTGRGLSSCWKPWITTTPRCWLLSALCIPLTMSCLQPSVHTADVYSCPVLSLVFTLLMFIHVLSLMFSLVGQGSGLVFEGTCSKERTMMPELIDWVGTRLCITVKPFFRVPFISRISRPWRIRENNGPRIYILAAVY